MNKDRTSVAGKNIKVYVAGPYTKGDVAVNVREAIIAGNNLRALGYTPFIPHLTHFWHLQIPHSDIEFWYQYDLEWLAVCDAVFRLPGESVGADQECARAKELGMPVFTNYLDLSKLVKNVHGQ
jgi:hypothetical protein